MYKLNLGRWMVSAAIIMSPLGIQAQDRDRDRDQPPPPPPHERMTRIEAGTLIAVRTNESIQVRSRDNRIFYGTVDADVVGGNGRLAIPRGSQVEMIVREAPDHDLILDLDSVVINGERYGIDSDPNRIESGDARDGVGANKRTGEFVGGGAVIGSIIGAIAGGGKGAAIGAAAGAAAGASTQTLTRGREVRVPAEAIVTFRLERPLVVGVADRGRMRDGHHYHDEYDDHRQ
jgi:outer membrane lipoprotein SlyB